MHNFRSKNLKFKYLINDIIIDIIVGRYNHHTYLLERERERERNKKKGKLHIWSLIFYAMYQFDHQPFKCVNLVPNILILCQNNPYR